MDKKNESSSTPPHIPFWKTALLAVTVGVIGAVIGSTAMGMENVKRKERKRSMKEDVDQLSDALQKATMEEYDKESYVPVASRDKLYIAMQALSDLNKNLTLLVHGPRGVGKTTLMQHSLNCVKGVVHIQPNPLTVKNFYESIFEYVDFKTQSKSHAALVIHALKKIKADEKGIKPTFVVDVNEKCSEKELMAILIELKKLVADLNLANGAVILSTSRAALLLPVTLHELRVRPVNISDPPRRTIVNFLEKHLVKLFPDSKPEEREGWIASYSPEIGTRFLDAANLISELRIAKSKGSLTTPKTVSDSVQEFVSQRKKTYRSSALKFVTMVDKRKRKEVLTGIINNDLPLDKLVEATGIKDEESLIKTLANLHPHPVYIDVSTSLVGAGNFVASSEFKKIIK